METVSVLTEPSLIEPPAKPTHPRKKISAKKAAWTQEKKDALAEKMREKWAERRAREATAEPAQEEIAAQPAAQPSAQPAAQPTVESGLSPFALSDEHEFPTSPSLVDRVDVYRTSGSGTPTLIGSGKPGSALMDTVPADPVATLVEPPALPGTPLSSYRRCPCLAVLPGRVCSFCYGTHWMKFCSKCAGEGRIQITVRQGAERSQPCGHCNGRGTLPANMKEIGEAIRLAEEFAASPEGHSSIIDDPSSAPTTEFRRAVKLPGIGVTAIKRGGTLAARRKDRLRNEQRKQKRVAGKQAGQGTAATAATN
ncbi:MAG: hypothetical protein OK454_02175 [Thaumarchaeota archaeon]|nr:hypothetical protein [Nitrososphaerota archaeon]